MPDALRVSAPASSANLGPGFDCLALALELRNVVEITRGVGEAPLVQISGEGAGEAPADAENLFLLAFQRGGGDITGLEFTMTNRVPFARGLGSSAATIAAGLVAAQACLTHLSHRSIAGLGNVLRSMCCVSLQQSDNIGIPPFGQCPSCQTTAIPSPVA